MLPENTTILTEGIASRQHVSFT